jgi:hypothetical protein
MKIFTFSCRSSCGSYFVPYLKEVTVRAETLFQARNYLEEWLEKKDFNFIDEQQVNVEQNNQDVGVVHFDFSSDY